jgi:hypothetical protein
MLFFSDSVTHLGAISLASSEKCLRIKILELCEYPAVQVAGQAGEFDQGVQLNS